MELMLNSQDSKIRLQSAQAVLKLLSVPQSTDQKTDSDDELPEELSNVADNLITDTE